MPQLNRRQFIASLSAAAGFMTLSGVRVLWADEKKLLKARLKRDFEVLDPAHMIGSQECAAIIALFPRLAELDTSGKSIQWRPSVYMERLELVDDLHIEFELKRGFQWTNGYGELSAQDVKYSLERAKAGDYGNQFQAIKEVRVTGSHTGTIVLEFPYGPLFIESLAMAVGAIVCQAAVEKTPEKRFTLNIPASCGPYIIQEHIPKQKTTLARNPAWIGPKPDFDEIQCILVAEVNAAELAYEAGEIDLTRIESNRIPRYQENPPPHTVLRISGQLNYSWVGMNTEHPKLRDPRVREAIGAAINTRAIHKVAFKGVATPANGTIPPGLAGHRETSGLRYDPSRAKALLEEAGVDRLELDLVALAKRRQHMLAAQIIQNNLKEVGVAIKIKPLDSGPYWSLGREKKGDAWKDSQLWIMAFGGTVDPSSYVQYFISNQVGNWNWERWRSDEFDALYKQGMAESDPAKRHAIYVTMQEIMEKTYAYVWLIHEPEAYIHKDSIFADFDPEGTFLFPTTRKL